MCSRCCCVSSWHTEEYCLRLFVSHLFWSWSWSVKLSTATVSVTSLTPILVLFLLCLLCCCPVQRLRQTLSEDTCCLDHEALLSAALLWADNLLFGLDIAAVWLLSSSAAFRKPQPGVHGAAEPLKCQIQLEKCHLLRLQSCLHHCWCCPSGNVLKMSY